MEVLYGEYTNTLDEKGRVSLPARLRSELDENAVVVTQGIDGCLWVFPPAQWKEFSRKILENTSPFQAKGRLVQRWIIGPSQEIEIDKLGRISIPQGLRELAGLEKDCEIIGVGKFIEIWNAERYKAYRGENVLQFQEAAEELGLIRY
jgi:MraZ protein